jgi:hypothetical protein
VSLVSASDASKPEPAAAMGFSVFRHAARCERDLVVISDGRVDSDGGSHDPMCCSRVR